MKNLNLRRLISILIMLGFSLLLASCSDFPDLTDKRIPKFDGDIKVIKVDVDFEGIAGDISHDEFSRLIKSKDLKIRVEYIPLTLIPDINSDFEFVWGSYLPIPRGWELKPRLKYIDLTRDQYDIKDNHIISFSLNKSIGMNYVVDHISIKIPNPVKKLKWELEPISLQIHLADELAIDYSEPPLRFYTLAGSATHQVPFQYENILFGMVGNVKLNGAYPVVTKIEFNEKNTIKKDGDKYAFRPLSKYARYEEALRNYEKYITLSDDEKMSEIIRLWWKLEEINGSNQVKNEEQDDIEIKKQKIENEYIEKLTLYSGEIRKNMNWQPTERLQRDLPESFESMKVTKNFLVFSKINGHLLEYLDVGLSKESDMDYKGCIKGEEYEIFFVDKNLINFESKKYACRGYSYADLIAKLDDNKKLVFYQESCNYCDSPMLNNTPDKASIVSIMKTTKNIRKAFLLDEWLHF